MIDHDILTPARHLAAHGLHSLDQRGTLRVPSAIAAVVGTETTGSLVARQTTRLVGPHDGGADDRNVAADRAGGTVGRSNLPSANLVALHPFEVKYGQRRRDCVVLVEADGLVLVLFATWDSFAALCEHLGTEHAAKAIMALPAEKLLGFCRAYVRGVLDRADWTLRLREADGSGRSWSELSESKTPPSPWRIAVVAEAAYA